MSKEIPIIYGSASGNVEYVCQELCVFIKEREQLKLDPTLYRSEAVAFEVIDTNDTFIFSVSTWGHGIPNPYFDRIIDYFESHNMSGKRACFIGLGDSKYEPVLFCEGINIAQRAWEKAGGKTVGTTLKINGLPHTQMYLVKDWFNETFRDIT